MESHESNHETEPQQQQPSPTSSLPPPQPHNLQRVTMALVGPNPFTNTTVPTTMITPATARFPLVNMNINHSSHFDSFNNNINSTLTAPPTGPSTTLMPCMTVVGDSSSHFPSDSGSINRKRGSPRKYFAENEVDLGLGSSSGSSQAQAAAIAPPPDSLVKSTRGRGRPRGSFSQKNDVEVFGGLVGTCVSPYVIIVNRGEDIVAKLTASCHGGPNSEMCILAAHGSVSTVTLYHSGNIVTYEGGQFEIVSLSGTLLPGNNNGDKRMGSWKVTLGGGPNAQIWGGVVADKLIAASSVKVILGSFTVDGKEAGSSNQNPEPSVPSFEFAASRTPTIHYNNN